MKIQSIHPHNVDDTWPLIAGGLIKACNRTGGRVTPDYLYRCCITGDKTYVVTSDEENLPFMACVVTFENWGGERVCYINATHGTRMRESMELLKGWAKYHGATSVTWDGTEGYKKTFPEAETVSQTYKLEI